jgi:hypothetical protein
MKDAILSDPFPYTLRKSAKAKKVRLKMSAAEGLVVTIPAGYNLSQLPAILERHRKWIESTARKIEQLPPPAPTEPKELLPTRLELHAIGQTWAIEYCPTEADFVELRIQEAGRLVVSGDTDNIRLCRFVLKKWLARKAHQHLTPWLLKLAAENGFKFNRIIVRDQKSRWASCSQKGTISLNQRLLFIAPDLVQCILVHELCHTIHLDHSAKFWALVEKHAPDYPAKRRAIRALGKELPAWVTCS